MDSDKDTSEDIVEQEFKNEEEFPSNCGISLISGEKQELWTKEEFLEE